jgi:pyruvate/2-oxoglutarate dehydrogenase complex dihydrolipoamide dehydrogenase (E3) component
MSNSSVESVSILPMDEYNQTLVSYVHPNDWVNPTPAATYDLVVIGAGTAGLVVAAGAAGLGLGLKVALIEKHLMGGDCLNVGCVPSKCIIRSSRVIGELWGAKELGIQIPEAIAIDFPAVMERMRRLRAGISHNDSATRFQQLGVDVFLGNGRFSSSDTIEVGGKTLQFKKAVIATGARAVRPPLQGIEEVGFLTNETVFSLTERPNRLAVIGGGPIGCELAQAFRRLGCEVVLFHRGSHLLNKEDADAADIVQKTFLREGIRLVLNAQMERVEKTSAGKTIYFKVNGNLESIAVDEILAGAERPM